MKRHGPYIFQNLIYRWIVSGIFTAPGFSGWAAKRHPSRWLFAVLAVFLPYLGVVGANAGREKGSFPEPEAVTPTFAALPSASSLRQTSGGS